MHVAVICEGPTERILVETLLASHFQKRQIYLTPTLLTKKGQKGGDVRFDRLRNDLRIYLSQSHNACVTTLIDFYGLKGEWPGYDEAKGRRTPGEKAMVLAAAVKTKVLQELERDSVERRFLPYFSMHETEALYFSSPEVTARHLNVNVSKVTAILDECGEPEVINHHEVTSPSHRLSQLASFKKTTTGIEIARNIGLQTMRQKCPVFDAWVTTLESLSAA
jgi:hypothetical protein